jgi:hypothetical protein
MIEAMKQALEALETCMYPQQKQIQAITSLRQAIALEESLVAEAKKQEPVMGVEVKRIASGGFIGNVWWIHENLQEGVFHLYTHPQPKREWVGLPHEEIDYQAKKDDHGVYFALGALWAEARLKEKNT